MRRVLKPGGILVMLDPFVNGALRRVICKTLNAAFRERDTNLFIREQMHNLFLAARLERIQHRTMWYYKLITVGVKGD